MRGSVPEIATSSDIRPGLIDSRDALAAGSVTSVELVERSLAAIEATQQTLNAFRCVRREAALAEAEEADRRRAVGEAAPLLGVPVAIKDDVDLAGETTAFGCVGDFEVKTADSELVSKVKRSGAVIVGKTNTPEFGQWPVSEGPAFGVARNPWNLDHTPGGSSGGSAAAVAAGLVPAALGSDGAGSVRIPASWTDLVGIKPQRGRISTWPDPEAFCGLTCYGPLASTVADAALLLDVLAGNIDGDRHRPPAAEGPYLDAAGRDPGTLRIALSYSIPFSGPPARLDRGVHGCVEGIATTLSELGHRVEPFDLKWGLVGVGFLPRSMGGIREWSERVPDSSLLDPRTRHNARNGRIVGGAPGLAVARAVEPLLHRHFRAVFKDFDVVITPTTAQPPLPIGSIDGLSDWETDKRIVAACPYAWPWNVIGWPGVNVPAGFVDGLPVGAQLLGPANSESLLISIAAQLEGVLRWQDRSPPPTTEES